MSKVLVDREVLESAFDAINNHLWGGIATEIQAIEKARTELRAALERPGVEPVAWTSMGQIRFTPPTSDVETYNPLYAAPQPAQQAVGRGRLISESESGVIRSLIEIARITYQALDDSEELTGHSGQYISVSKGDCDAITAALGALDDLPDDCPGYTLGPAGKAEWALRMLLEQNSTALQPAQPGGDTA